MAKKLVAKEIRGLDPDTGELLFEFEEVDDGKGEKPPEVIKKEVEEFSGGKPENVMSRYKAIQGWTTRVQQENSELRRRLAKLEGAAESKARESALPRSTLPVERVPDTPDMEAMFSDPRKLQEYVTKVVHSQFGLIGKYVREQVEPFWPILSAYNTHNELQRAVSSYPDFGEWRKEMLDISKALKDGEEMSIEELYHEARRLNPDKAMRLDGNLGSDEDEASGTEEQTPETQTQPADAENEGFSDDLLKLAARTTTETGIADGASPMRSISGIDAAMEAAWDDMSDA